MSAEHDFAKIQAAVVQAFAPGTTVDGTYLIDKSIGCGAMGVVLKARDVKLERDVALKVVMLPKYADVLRSEAVVMGRLRHDNLLQIHAFGEHRGFAFFVMELVEGTSLGALLKREGPLHLSVACGILRKISSALAVVHAAGVVHRDIKPGNILIGRDYRVALADFGLVAMSAKGRISGTPSYVPPELVEGVVVNEKDRHLSDQYSLAVTAFELLTGVVPFQANEVHALLVKRVLEPPPLITSKRPDLPAALDPIFRRALSRNPHDRYSDCASFVAALDSVSQRETEREELRNRRHILVVDDDEDMIRLYQAVLSSIEDVELTCTKDALVGLEFARAQPPSVIFLDLQMPRFNGIDFVAKALGDPRLKPVPIVVISSMVAAAAARAGRHEARSLSDPSSSSGLSSASFGALPDVLKSLGVKEQIAKPVLPDALLDAAERYLPGLINRTRTDSPPPF